MIQTWITRIAKGPGSALGKRDMLCGERQIRCFFETVMRTGKGLVGLVESGGGAPRVCSVGYCVR